MEPHSGANSNSRSSDTRRRVTLSSRSAFSRVCNGFLTAFEQVARAGRRPNTGSLLSTAERQTGLNDFGDHRFLEPMAFLLESVEREAKLNALGRFVFVEHVVQLLRNRLYLELDWKLDPTIALRKIPKPVLSPVYRERARPCYTACSPRIPRSLPPRLPGKSSIRRPLKVTIVVEFAGQRAN